MGMGMGMVVAEETKMLTPAFIHGAELDGRLCGSESFGRVTIARIDLKTPSDKQPIYSYKGACLGRRILHLSLSP